MRQIYFSIWWKQHLRQHTRHTAEAWSSNLYISPLHLLLLVALNESKKKTFDICIYLHFSFNGRKVTKLRKAPSVR